MYRGIVCICRVGTKTDANGEEFFEPRIKCLYKVKGVIYTINLENKDSWNSIQWRLENLSRYYPSGFTLSASPFNLCQTPRFMQEKSSPFWAIGAPIMLKKSCARKTKYHE
jgi:hypothetical protein